LLKPSEYLLVFGAASLDKVLVISMLFEQTVLVASYMDSTEASVAFRNMVTIQTVAFVASSDKGSSNQACLDKIVAKQSRTFLVVA